LRVEPDLLAVAHDGQVAVFGNDDLLTRPLTDKRGRGDRRLSGRRHRRGDGRKGRGILTLIGSAVGHEYALPFARARLDIVHVNHEVLVLVVEDPRLDLFLDRRGEHLGFEALQLGIAARKHDIHQVKVEQEHREAEDEDRSIDRSR
jgi:hypothetical protein